MNKQQNIDPEVRNLILKIVCYALTAIASFIGGNACAQNSIINLF